MYSWGVVECAKGKVRLNVKLPITGLNTDFYFLIQISHPVISYPWPMPSNTFCTFFSINVHIIFHRSRYIAFFLFIPKQKFMLKDYLKCVGEGIKNFAEFFSNISRNTWLTHQLIHSLNLELISKCFLNVLIRRF